MQVLRCRQLDPDPKLCYFGSATIISMYYCGGGGEAEQPPPVFLQAGRKM